MPRDELELASDFTPGFTGRSVLMDKYKHPPCCAVNRVDEITMRNRKTREPLHEKPVSAYNGATIVHRRAR